MTHRLPRGATWAERFWSHVDQSGECWFWQAHRATGRASRYPWPGPEGPMRSVHEIAYLLGGRTLPPGHWVQPACGTADCLRPDHAETRSPAQQRAAHSQQVRAYLAAHPEAVRRGAAAGVAKLTDSQVETLRRQWATGEYRYEDLCQPYGLDPSTLFDIVTGRSWTHLPVLRYHRPQSLAAPRGEDHPNHVLTEPEVVALREQRAREGTPWRQLGEDYGISRSQAHAIVRRKAWKHVE